DLERDVDPPVHRVLESRRVDVDGGAADDPVEVLDSLDAVAQLGAREDIAGGELDPALDLLDGEHGVAGQVDAAHPELRPLHDHDPDDDGRARAVDLDVR